MHAIGHGHVEIMLSRRFRRLARTRTVRKIVNCVNESDADTAACRVVVAISLVEMSARPTDARLVEWLFALPGRTGLLGRRVQRWSEARTVGPLQLRCGPFRVRNAVKTALGALEGARIDLAVPEQIAAFWNGTVYTHNGSVLYQRLLCVAFPVADRLLD